MAANFRVGLAGAYHPDNVARSLEARACNLANGDLYLYPNRSSPAIDATKPITFTWATDCSMSSLVDIYLYAPAAAQPIAHGWLKQPYSIGQMTAQLQPNYWNSTTTAMLYILIVDSGTQPFTGIPGPVFTVDYPAADMYSTTVSNGQTVTSTNPAAAAQSTNAVFENVNSTSKGGISKGGIAAAVIVPILVLAALIAVAVRFWRQREAEKRKKWSRAMSSHSNLEWEKGAQPGEKPQSILGRPSMSSFHGGRAASIAASSVFATENMAGAGSGMVRPPYTQFSQSADNLHHNQNRSSLMLPEGNARQSRISFAEAARPNRDSRLSVGPEPRSGIWKLPLGSRSATELNTPNKPKQAAYATGSAIADEEDDINISPSQLQGPNAFAEAEMRRVGGNKNRTGRKSILSFSGSRRESVVSHLSADDFRSAADARGSTDELRDLEATMLARRSVLSQYSGSKSSPDLHNSPNPGQWSNPASPYLQQYDSNAAETLSHDEASYGASTPNPIPSTGSSSTVAYGPDQMLAVYAARAKGNGPAVPAQAAAAPSKKQGIRILTGLGKKNNDEGPSSASEMKSYVHLNNGTASSAAVDALPLPGPSGFRVPVPGRNRSGTVTRDDEDIGQAK